MKNIRVIIIFILIMCSLFFSFFYKKEIKQIVQKKSKTTISINDIKLKVSYLEGKNIDSKDNVQNIILINNNNNQDVIIAYKLNDIKYKDSSYSLAISDDNKTFTTLVNNKLFSNDGLLGYDIVIPANSKKYLRLDVNGGYIKGEIQITENINALDFFLNCVDDYHNNLLDRIDSLNGINESGFYIDEINNDLLTGYVFINANDISDIKYIYNVYNDIYYLNNININNYKKNVIEITDELRNNISFDNTCKSNTKKECVSFSNIQYLENGGRKNFNVLVSSVIDNVKKLNSEKEYVIYDVTTDMSDTNLRGYILVDNIKKEYYLYLTNDLFMISGYNYTKLGKIDDDSVTIRAYNETAFNLSSKDPKTVCNFSGFEKCYLSDGSEI